MLYGCICTCAGPFIPLGKKKRTGVKRKINNEVQLPSLAEPEIFKKKRDWDKDHDISPDRRLGKIMNF